MVWYSLVQQGVFLLRLEQRAQPGLHHDVDLLVGIVWKGALEQIRPLTALGEET